MTPLPGATDALEARLEPSRREFYRDVLEVFHAARIPYLVGGAYALAHYTGVVRDTKDLDLFVREKDSITAIGRLRTAGWSANLTFPHWLGKVFSRSAFVDIIFANANGLSPVDDVWFDHAVESSVFGVPVKLCPAEEMIVSKCYVMERDRYDGADVAHLIRYRGPALDWSRLLGRFGEQWRLLLAHLVLFGFIYPDNQRTVPSPVLDELLARLEEDRAGEPEGTNLCRGTLLSRSDFLDDLALGARDARLAPWGPLTEDEVRRWTDAIDEPEITHMPHTSDDQGGTS